MVYLISIVLLLTFEIALTQCYVRNNDDIYEILEDPISCYTVRPFEYKSNDYVVGMELNSIDEIIKTSEKRICQGEREAQKTCASEFV